MEPTGDARQPFSVKFYLVAMVFILFDVEAIFLYPWAYIYRDMIGHSVQMGRYGFTEMLVYIAILLVGNIYLWKKGAFDWHKYSAHLATSGTLAHNTNQVPNRLPQ